MDRNELAGRRILIVEDEYYLAEDLADAVRAAGGEVVGPVGNLPDAEARVAQGGFDCAVLDINLHGEFAFPIARRIEAAGVPFVIATGYNSGALPADLERHRRIEKPFDQEKVIEAIADVLAGAPVAEP
jgi:DNA-binding NtrC family response regulator